MARQPIFIFYAEKCTILIQTKGDIIMSLVNMALAANLEAAQTMAAWQADQIDSLRSQSEEYRFRLEQAREAIALLCHGYSPNAPRVKSLLAAVMTPECEQIELDDD
jgi:hypothetical protein